MTESDDRAGEHAVEERAAALPGWRGFRVAAAQMIGGDDVSPVGVSAVYYPAIGLLLGAAMLAVDELVRRRLGVAAASIGVVVLHATATRGRSLGGLAATLCRLTAPRRRPAPLVVGAAAIAIAAGASWLLARVDGGRGAVLLFSPMLAGCAMVVLATGSRQARADGRQMKFSRDLTFREFGTASTLSFALVFLSTNFLGLLLVLVTGVATIAVRLLLHWRLGGVDRASLWGTGEVVQISLFALMATL